MTIFLRETLVIMNLQQNIFGIYINYANFNQFKEIKESEIREILKKLKNLVKLVKLVKSKFFKNRLCDTQSTKVIVQPFTMMHSQLC